MKDGDIDSLEQPSRAKSVNVADEEDPYLSFGFGFVAYFSLLRTMIVMFFLFSLLSIYPLWAYTSNDGMVDAGNYSRARFSIGNLGFQEALCQRTFLDLDEAV